MNKSILQIILLFIIIIIIIYNLCYLNRIEKFTISSLNEEEFEEKIEGEFKEEFEEKENSKLDRSEIEDIFKSESNVILDENMIQNQKNTKMDLKDLYSNLCPLDYNINMIKLNNNVTRINQYPGYTRDTFIDITRQIKSDEALPTTADFFK